MKTARPATALTGTRPVPGDKSMSHRSLLLGTVAEGVTRVTGLLEGDDVLRTAAAMRALGADIERDDTGGEPVWTIAPRDPARSGDAHRLYFGNAGTGARLAMGLVAGLGVEAQFDGDESLRRRPMGRILDPLSQMGVAATSRNGCLPVRLEPSAVLSAIRYRLPVASAQIKSALLLAGLFANGTTIVEEPVPSRDHTENMLRAFGAEVGVRVEGEGRVITLEGQQRLTGRTITIPGDPSSAAFPIAAALIVPGSAVTIRGVMMNPLRTGLITTLLEMGADIRIENERAAGGEPVADLCVRHAPLKGLTVPPSRAPAMIDEYPILSVIAAFAEGETVMEGIGELRVKESDRIEACCAGLVANGITATAGKDWMRVTGSAKAPAGGACVPTHHDHRIAMAFLVFGLGSLAPVSIDDDLMINTSFPGFFDLMTSLGAEFS